MDIPNRITQSWIERNLPSASVEEAFAVVAVLVSRGWTEEELQERVAPFIRGDLSEAERVAATLAPESGPGNAPTVAEEMPLLCPRGHEANYPQVEGFRQFTCPICAEKRKSHPDFHVGAWLICRGMETHRKTERSLTGSHRIRRGADYRLSYANPAPPPPEQLLSFTSLDEEGIYLRSGQRFSVVYKRGLFGTKFIHRLTNYEVGQSWLLSAT
jgi:hypothetical protein